MVRYIIGKFVAPVNVFVGQHCMISEELFRPISKAMIIQTMIPYDFHEIVYLIVLWLLGSQSVHIWLRMVTKNDIWPNVKFKKLIDGWVR